MTGLRINIPGHVFPAPIFGKIKANDFLESQGSLYLVEPGSNYRPMSGVPADGSRVSNIVGASASRLVGDGDVDATLQSSLTGSCLLERSTKGGLHFAHRSGSGYAMLRPSRSIISYMRANVGHQFYFSWWSRVTRAASGIDAFMISALSAEGAGAAVAGNSLHYASDASLGFGGTNIGAYRNPTGNKDNYVGPYMHAVTNQGFTKAIDFTPDQIIADRIWRFPSMGKAGAGSLTATLNRSFLIYRFYVEDLTVSGRTHAQVLALDSARYTQEVLTAGGKYHGDTWTDPLSLAA